MRRMRIEQCILVSERCGHDEWTQGVRLCQR